MDGLLNKVINVFNFSPDTSIPSLTDKVIVVTGGNQGIGGETVFQLAKHSPRRVYLAARSKAKFDDALANIKERSSVVSGIEYLELDLASLSSVSRAAKQISAENDRLDMLINSAGIMGVPPGTTKDGYEMHFGVNHLGHALLTRSLLPLLEKTAAMPGSDVRIVNVSSVAEMMAPASGFLLDQVKGPMKSFHPFKLYGISKLANILHAKELAKRYPNITSVSVHPGRVGTGLLDGYFGTNGWSPMALFQKAYDRVVGALTVEEGALNTLWAAAGKKEDVKNGEYYLPVGKEDQVRRKNTEALAKELWDWQEAEFVSKGFS